MAFGSGESRYHTHGHGEGQMLLLRSRWAARGEALARRRARRAFPSEFSGKRSFADKGAGGVRLILLAGPARDRRPAESAFGVPPGWGGGGRAAVRAVRARSFSQRLALWSRAGAYGEAGGEGGNVPFARLSRRCRLKASAGALQSPGGEGSSSISRGRAGGKS